MAIRPEILAWLRRRRERAQQIETDASTLIREFGSDAYAEARLMQRRAKSFEDRRHWRNVALAIAHKSAKRIGLDTATRMAMEVDFSERRESGRESAGLEPRKVDPIEELSPAGAHVGADRRAMQPTRPWV